HRFAERLEGRFDLVEARGVIEPEQTIDGFAIPAETAHQLGAGDTALTQRAVERGLERRHQRQRHRPAARSFGPRRDVLAAANASSIASTACTRASASSSPKVVTSGKLGQVASTVPLSSASSLTG